MASGEPTDNPPGLPRGLIGRTGTPAAKGGRLPSIRAPRDLTLGGIPKKIFAPNLTARREKPKQTSETVEVTPAKNEVQEKQKKETKKIRPGTGRGRGRGKETIQSHSIFEQGPTEKLQKGGSGFSETMRQESTSRSKVSAPSMVKKRTDDRTKKVLDQLLSDDFVDYVDDEDHNFDPIRLPLSAVVKREIKTEMRQSKIKAETTSDGDDMQNDDKSVDKPITRTSVTTFRSPDDLVTCSQLFTVPSKSEEGELLFLQLPSILPGTPACPAAPPHPDKSSDKTNTEKDTEKDAKTKNNSCSLRDFSEGLIGKLVIRKSGRTQLLLGNITLDVSMGTPCAFLQDLASVRTSGESGDMTVLGHIQHRLVCTPDFRMLLNTSPSL